MYNCRGEREREREILGGGGGGGVCKRLAGKSIVDVCVLTSPDLIVFHLESLTDLRKELKRLPVAKVSHAPLLITLHLTRSYPWPLVPWCRIQTK